jgi:hypothetical protein
MKLVALCLALVACGGGDWKHSDPNRMPVEDVALWFAKASLAGDRATARMLMLEHYPLAGFTLNPPSPEEWNGELERSLDGFAREGADREDNELLRTRVVETKRLHPGDEQKLKDDVRLAVVRLDIHQGGDWRAAPMPLLFVDTPQGWKFTPKK